MHIGEAICLRGYLGARPFNIQWTNEIHVDNALPVNNIYAVMNYQNNSIIVCVNLEEKIDISVLLGKIPVCLFFHFYKMQFVDLCISNHWYFKLEDEVNMVFETSPLPFIVCKTYDITNIRKTSLHFVLRNNFVF